MSVIPDRSSADLQEDASTDYGGHCGNSSSSYDMAENLTNFSDIHPQTARFVQLNRPALIQEVVTLRAWSGWSAMARFYSRAMKFDVRIVHPNLTQSVRPLEEAGAEGKKECTSCKKESVCTTCAVDSHNGHLMSRALTKQERLEAAKVDVAGLKAKIVIGLEDFKSRCEKIKMLQEKWIQDSKAALDEVAMLERLLNSCDDDTPPDLMHSGLVMVERMANQLFEDATNGLVLEPGWNITCNQHNAQPSLATGPRANVLQQMAAVTRCLHCGQDQSMAVDVPAPDTADDGTADDFYRTFTLAATPVGGYVCRPRVTGLGTRRRAGADDTRTAATADRSSSTVPRGRREPSVASQADMSAAVITDEGGLPTHRTSIFAVPTPTDVYHPRGGHFGTRRQAPADDARAAASADRSRTESRARREPDGPSQDVSQQTAVGGGGRRPASSTSTRNSTAEQNWWFDNPDYGAQQPSPDNGARAATAAGDSSYDPDTTGFGSRHPTVRRPAPRNGTRAATAAGRFQAMPRVHRASDDIQQPSNIFSNRGFPSVSLGAPWPAETAVADFVELLEAPTREPPRSATARQLSDAEDPIVLYQDLDSSSNLFEVPSSPEPPRSRPRGRQFFNSNASRGGRGHRGAGFRGARAR
ncbi:hypothetical protein AAVH_02660 [Aphelenchoides avenae]|nr:hypothetical protein AAVH_02660 [Aphelenchus avenae]